jgi:hypothetical protein
MLSVLLLCITLQEHDNMILSWSLKSYEGNADIIIQDVNLPPKRPELQPSYAMLIVNIQTTLL